MTDHLIDHLKERDGIRNSEIVSFIKYIETEEYDTDSICMDVIQVNIGSINTYSCSNILVNVCTSIRSSILPRVMCHYFKHAKCVYFLFFIYLMYDIIN